MNEITKSATAFVGYEYKEVTVKQSLENLYVDSYTAFGWQYDGGGTTLSSLGTITLKFKRDRKIQNKTELARLQRHFEVAVKQIDQLEMMKTRTAAITAFTTGIVGSGFMAISVFSITGATTHLVLCIIFGALGFLAWGLAYPLFHRISAKKTVQMTELIEQKFDEIYDICQKATALIR
ncbi:hypothetical protein Hs30E_05870 [Lactococcus hodotermopsidis]|uniref:Uncharacterized protein n=1 Tax=Pseudolactococcus hodotermopsidis TaxID=2709157 RepID=A0A6A0BB37_9LACT|nr:hypothetical protein [Lactococcus hodotermopsidis]GFH42036.1 hypothetical protein Hs30E_05870 [Lactococcus hodotermopsidis]